MADTEPTALALIAKGLERVEDKLDDVLKGLGMKADRTELQALEADHEKLDKRVSALEEDKRIRAAKAEVHEERDQRSWFARTAKWKIVAGVVSITSGAAIAVTSVVQTFHHF